MYSTKWLPLNSHCGGWGTQPLIPYITRTIKISNFHFRNTQSLKKGETPSALPYSTLLAHCHKTSKIIVNSSENVPVKKGEVGPLFLLFKIVKLSVQPIWLKYPNCEKMFHHLLPSLLGGGVTCASGVIKVPAK